MRACEDCGVDISLRHHRSVRCEECQRSQRILQARTWQKVNPLRCAELNKRWKDKNPEKWEVIMQKAMKRQRECSLTMDDVVGIMRENGGTISRGDLKELVKSENLLPGNGVRHAKKAGLITEEDGILRLANTPMLAAVDGFYDEVSKRA